MTDTLTGHDVGEGTLLPESWSALPLGDLIESVRESATILTEETYELWSIPSFAEGEPEIVAGSSIGSGKLRVEPSDVLISKINPRINRVWIVEESQTGLDQVASTEWLVARISPGSSLRPDYLRLYATSPDFRALITEGTQGVTGSHTRAKTPRILRFSIPVPPLEEQERIVEILEDQLSRLDAALQSVHAVREKAAQFRRSLLHAAFTGALTGHDVEEGELPEGWSAATIGDTVRTSYGKSLDKSKRFEEGPIPVVGSAGLMAYTDSALAEGDVIVVGRKGNVGEVQHFKHGVWPIDTVYYFVAPPHLNAEYFFFNLVSKEMKQLDSSTSTPSLRREDMEQVVIEIPPLPEQERIVEILENQLARLDASLAVADAVEDRSAALRRSLLHSAFTGRLTREWREAVNV